MSHIAGSSSTTSTETEPSTRSGPGGGCTPRPYPNAKARLELRGVRALNHDPAARPGDGAGEVVKAVSADRIVAARHGCGHQVIDRDRVAGLRIEHARSAGEQREPDVRRLGQV